MAKILIAPLGVGDSNEDIYKRKYKLAKYRFEGDNEEIESPFVLSVLVEKLKVDKIIVVGTSKSMWEELYKHYSQKIGKFNEEYWKYIGEKVGKSNYKNHKLKEEDLKELCNVLDEYLKKINPNAKGGSKCLLIKYGINKEEIWENFDIFMSLTNEINDNDEIYLDITHSFRSIPLFMYVMLEFLRYFKNVKLEGIYYGMLDVYKELNYAPIVDLSPIFEILEWIKGMYEFTKYGNSYLISDLLEEENKLLANNLRKISIHIDANYLREVREDIEELNKILNNINEDSGRFTKYIIPKLKEFSERFNNVSSYYEFQKLMAEWNFDNKKYSSGYLCLTDSIFWMLCEKYGLTPTHKNRDLMKRLSYTVDLLFFKDVNAIYNWLRDIRNTIAHADAVRKGVEFNTEKDLENIEELYKKNPPNIEEVIDNLIERINNNEKNREYYLNLLNRLLKTLLIQKVINAYKLENNEIYWNFVEKNLLSPKCKNRCINEKLRDVIGILEELDNNEDVVDKVNKVMNIVNNYKDEDFYDFNVLICALLNYISFNLSKTYNVSSKDYFKVFKWLILNRRLCSKNQILDSLNNRYYKIFSYKRNGNKINDEILSYVKDIINQLNGDLSSIKKELPLDMLKKEYEKFSNSKNR
ncbi:TIGR02221 family CRISPR-associated protein [Methanocaldococcus sp.]